MTIQFLSGPLFFYKSAASFTLWLTDDNVWYDIFIIKVQTTIARHDFFCVRPWPFQVIQSESVNHCQLINNQQWQAKHSEQMLQLTVCYLKINDSNLNNRSESVNDKTVSNKEKVCTKWNESVCIIWIITDLH